MAGEIYPTTPNGRYFVVRGRLWRRSNPDLSAGSRQRLVNKLMTARRAVKNALKHKDVVAETIACSDVDCVKRALGERGPVWWTDGSPYYNRCMVETTPYANWFDNLK